MSGIIRGGSERIPEQLELPNFEPVGFGVGKDSAALDTARPDYNYALFRDGLALLEDPLRRSRMSARVWSPKEGFEG
jgi:hypothetical protein